MRFLWATSVAVRAAASVIGQNRWRSLLTLVVCGLGTGGVIIAGALAEVHLTELEDRLNILGGNLLVVSPNKLPPFPGRPRQLEHFISLVPEDAVALRERVQDADVVPVAARSMTIRFGNLASRVRLIGTTPDYRAVRGFEFQSGRFLAIDDEGERVIVLGSAVARELAPGGIPAGEVLFLGGVPYTVIGVLRPQGVNFAGEDEDHQAFIPLKTYQQRVANRLWLSHLYIQLPRSAESQNAVRAVQELLRGRHKRWDYQVDDVLVRNLADLATQQSELLTTVVWVVSVTGLLLLLMGVSGIATLMMLVVRQRRSEIGLRRALGATPSDIAFQFFFEGFVLAGAGLIGGVVIGIVGSVIAARISEVQLEWTAMLPMVGVFISVTASTVACVVPAIIAARLEPSVALQP